MHMRLVVAISLLVLSAVPAHAGPAPARHPPRLRPAAAAELLSADDLNAMVLALLGGRPQPVLNGSDARRREMQAAWGRLRGLLGVTP
jgi:hypothetical protein